MNLHSLKIRKVLIGSLFSGSNRAHEKEFLEARDLIKNLKDVVIELQDNAFEAEDSYNNTVQQLIEDQDMMKKRGRKRLNAFKDRLRDEETNFGNLMGATEFQECFA